jgi:hypothetical protein
MLIPEGFLVIYAYQVDKQIYLCYYRNNLESYHSPDTQTEYPFPLV